MANDIPVSLDLVLTQSINILPPCGIKLVLYLVFYRCRLGLCQNYGVNEVDETPEFCTYASIASLTLGLDGSICLRALCA